MSFTKSLSLRTKLLFAGSIAVALILVRANRDEFYGRMHPIPTANAAIVEGPNASDAKTYGEGHHSRRNASDGLFYVDALVNGRPLRFLVDTGASIMVLTAADAKAVGIEVGEQHYNSNVKTVGGKAEMAWATIDRIEIGGRNVSQLRAAVVRNGLGVSLLGQNALSKFESVTIKGDSLSIR
jgi:aspartyl protease family protein